MFHTVISNCQPVYGHAAWCYSKKVRFAVVMVILLTLVVPCITP